MVKIIFFGACFILAFCGLSTSTDIGCNYKIDSSSAAGRIYQCNINNNPNILTEESAQISAVSGTHRSSKTNDDVLSFDVRDKTVQFFPKGLEKFFKNIKAFWIDDCQLREVRQSDLKVFPDLVYFWLWGNDIEVIEEGLFDFNSKLELVAFYENRLIHIDPNVFDHLTKLSSFWFADVPCVAKDISNSIEQVQEVIKVVKSKCSNSGFLSLEAQIKTLEIESKSLNSAVFNAKLEVFEKSYNATKFSKFRPLNYKFQNLKSAASST